MAQAPESTPSSAPVAPSARPPPPLAHVAAAATRSNAPGVQSAGPGSMVRSATAGTTVASKPMSAFEQLEDALDCMHAARAPFLARFHVLGAVERRSGGQGVVQFAAIAGSPKQFALKVRPWARASPAGRAALARRRRSTSAGWSLSLPVRCAANRALSCSRIEYETPFMHDALALASAAFYVK